MSRPATGAWRSQHGAHPALGVDLEALVALLALQDALVLALDARLADDVARRVVLELRQLHLGVGDLADVAEDVRRDLAVRVLAHGDGRHLDAREQVRVLRDVADGLHRHVDLHDARLHGGELECS